MSAPPPAIYNSVMNKHKIPANGEILKYRSVMVLEKVGDEKVNHGNMRAIDALELAKSKNTDIIIVSEKANNVVCLIQELGKYKYELSKNDSHKHQPKQKEIGLSATIGKHDLETKLNHARELVDKGHNVKVVLTLSKYEFNNGMKMQAGAIITDFIKDFSKKGKLNTREKSFDCILLGDKK